MCNQWDISGRNVKLILIFFFSFISCRSFELPKKSQKLNLTLEFKNFVLSEDFIQNGKVCVVSHFALKCRSLNHLHKKKEEDQFISSVRNYNDTVLSAMPNTPVYYGLSLHLQKKKMFTLSGKLKISHLQMSLKKQIGLFIIKGFPPFYTSLNPGSNVQSLNKDSNFLLKQYFLQSYDLSGKEIIEIEKRNGKVKKFVVLNLPAFVKNNKVIIE